MARLSLRWISRFIGGSWIAIALLSGCSRESSFADYFAEYYARYPRANELPSVDEKVLLQRYRPRLAVGENQEGPISFYRDYIAHGVLYDSAGNQLSQQVDAGLLNRHRADPGMLFEHEPPVTTTLAAVTIEPTAFGRVDPVMIEGIGELSLLTYHFVFRHSGLPEGLPTWQQWLLDRVVDR